MHKDYTEVLFTEEQIASKVKELGKQITKDFNGNSIIAVGILKGAVVFYSDLIRNIDLDVKLDFIFASSYGDSTVTSGRVNIQKDMDNDIEGKHVLIIEDIADTGVTLSNLIEVLKSRKPASIKVCCLLDKPSRRTTEFNPDYIGFTIPDKFVIGYGLDYAEKYRNLPDIGVLKPEIYE